MVIGGFNVSGGGIVDHGKLQGLGDDDHTQYAEIANAETITGEWDMSAGGLILPAASSTPSSSEGKIYYDQNTDLLYFYDSSRSKWLSVELFSFTAATKNAISAFYLIHHDASAPFGATRGIVAPRNGTLVGLFRSWTGSPSVEARANGTTLGTALGGFNSYDVTQNADFSAGQHLTLYANGSSPGVNHYAGLIARWRA